VAKAAYKIREIYWLVVASVVAGSSVVGFGYVWVISSRLRRPGVGEKCFIVRSTSAGGAVAFAVTAVAFAEEQ
jgi:hypothetical protein